MDPLAAVFIFCFVFGVATSLLSFALGAIHIGGGHSSGHGHALFGLGDVGHGHGPLGPGDGGHGGASGAGHAGAAHGGAHGGQSGMTAHGGSDGPHGHAALHEGHVGETSPFNLQTITAFMAFFGGTGWVAYTSGGLAPALALIIATLAGFAGGGVVFWFLVKVLIAGQSFLDPTDERMEGTVARVTRTIRPESTGEIVYSREGSRHSEGAVSASGNPIDEGTEVVIVRYERGLAYVEPWTSYAGEA